MRTHKTWRRGADGSANRRSRIAELMAAAAVVALGASSAAVAQNAPNPAPPKSAAPSDDGQWTMPAKNYASTRYSELKDITSENASQLQMAFSFPLGVKSGQEAAPIVVGDTMYVVTSYPNHVYALDLSKPGGNLKWSYDPTPVPAAQGVACCDVVNRGGVYANGMFIFNALDGRTIALDAATGKEKWITQVGDITKGETITMAPLVVKDRVFAGVSGGEFGIRGRLTGMDLNTGKIAWVGYHTGPDKEVLIGDDFKPFYAMDQGKDLGISTWPQDAWKIGGAPMWGWLSYDPDLDLIYYGVGNPGPWNAEQRPGDNKWTAGMFARNPETGAAKWFYQFTPHDVDDYDGVNEMVLLDVDVNGTMRKVLMHPDRNGFLYEIDRQTGEVIAADAYGYINSSTGVDLKTGRLQRVADKTPTTEHVTRDICPTASGAKDWQPSSYSPQTGLLYIPHNNLCMDWTNVQTNYIAGTPYVGAEVVMKPGPGGNRGAVTAWDVNAHRPAWEIQENFPAWSGTLATAGNLVFYGTMEGWFKAVDAKTGELKWRFKTDSGIIGQPIAYKGPDGREYVAVLSGVGGWAGAIVPGNLDPRDPTGALGFVGAMPDLKQATTAGGTLYVFALPK
jgi:PQQ-dependent dehydrogenase (methanol/ethanol family)